MVFMDIMIRLKNQPKVNSVCYVFAILTWLRKLCYSVIFSSNWNKSLIKFFVLCILLLSMIVFKRRTCFYQRCICKRLWNICKFLQENQICTVLWRSCSCYSQKKVTLQHRISFFSSLFVNWISRSNLDSFPFYRKTQPKNCRI